LDKFGMDWKTKNHETFHGTKFQSNGWSSQLVSNNWLNGLIDR
jgi:hypothetical protein